MRFSGYIMFMQSQLKFVNLLWAWIEFHEPIKLQTWGSASECLMCFRHFCLIVLEGHINISVPYQPKFPEPLNKVFLHTLEICQYCLFIALQKIQFRRQRWHDMNSLEGSLPSLYNLCSVCRITSLFVGRQCIAIHFEPFIRGRIEPLCSPPTSTDS